MIDLTSESPLSLNQAARWLPPGRCNRPVSFNCVLRWILNGANGPDGQIVRLEAVRLGGRWLTSREAIQRFAEALTPPTSDRQMSPARIRRQRRRTAEHTERELDKLGL
jgi:hypothetical protein